MSSTAWTAIGIMVAAMVTAAVLAITGIIGSHHTAGCPQEDSCTVSYYHHAWHITPARH